MEYLKLTSAAVALLLATGANAATIYSPVSILANTAGNFTAGAEVENAFNGSGLSTSFVSGVTDLDTYLSGNPLHTTTFSTFEWFSAGSGYVDLDMGSVVDLQSLLIWNEEGGNGVGSLDVFTSLDLSFSSLVNIGSFNPAQNVDGVDYAAELLDITDSSAQYLRLQFSGASGGVFGLGEIAFSDGVPSAVPVPAAVWLFASGLMGLVGLARRKKA